MLKTIGSPTKPASSKKNDSRSASSRNDNSQPVSRKNNSDGEVDRFGKIEYAKKLGKSKGEKLAKSRKSSKSKSKKSKKRTKSGNLPNFGVTESGLSFLTPKARATFNRLRLAFTKAPIFRHFDPECHIWIETDLLSYAISSVLSHLAFETRSDGVVTKTNLSQWHPIAFFSRKMIPAKTWYKTHNGKLLAIVKAFKTWHHYLKSCKHEVFVLMDHNNLRRFIDTKNLSSRQVRWGQELSRYHFWIDYCQGKANAAVNALLRFSQRNQDEENELRAENSQIFHCLQNSLSNASLIRLSLLSLSFLPSYLHQVLIYGTYVLPQLREFWNSFQNKL